jgi:hypothetical protein
MNDNQKLYQDIIKPLSITVGIITLSSFTAIAQIANPNVDFGSGIKLISKQMQEQYPTYSPSIANLQQDIIYFDRLISFADKFIKSQINLDTESQKILNDNFWDLI